MTNQRKKQLYEFKLLYPDNELAFKAYISNKTSYRIVYDLDDVFKPIFLKIINGKYKQKLVKKTDLNSKKNRIPKIELFKIDSDNAIENLKKFIENINYFYNYRADIQKVNFDFELSFIFKGSDYSYNDFMTAEAFAEASQILSSACKAIKKHSPNFEEFQEEPIASSLKLPIKCLDNTKQIKTSILEILKIFEKKSEKVNFNKFDDLQVSFINSLIDLKKMKNLKSFLISLDNLSYKIDLDYLIFLKSLQFHNKEFNLNTEFLYEIGSLKSNRDIISFKAIALDKIFKEKQLTFHLKKSLYSQYNDLFIKNKKLQIEARRINTLTFNVKNIKSLNESLIN